MALKAQYTVDCNSRDVWLYVSTIALLFIFFTSCSPLKYVSVENYNPAVLTFPPEMRRLLIVNNAVSQPDVPFESSVRRIPDSLKITADSTAFDFCRTLGTIIAEFPGFDDVRLLDNYLRTDQLPLSAPVLTREVVGQLCDEHEVDVVVSLDRLLFRLKEYANTMYGLDVSGVVDVEMEGILRVYVPTRQTPLTTIELADTITLSSDLMLERNDLRDWDLLFSHDRSNLLRESAKFQAEAVRIHFIPHWMEDIRWYYVASGSRWKEASAYAVAERWEKASEVWKALYGRTSSWKQKARLASNIALGMELTGDLDEALQYANVSHQLLHEQLGADHSKVKRQELYVQVLTHRIEQERKLRRQINL